MRFVKKLAFPLVFVANALLLVSFFGGPERLAQGAAQLILNPVSGSIPAPLFDGKAHSDSYNVTGTEGATCTPTNVTFTEDPVSSGLYAAEFDGASGILSCGTGLDGLHSGPATFLAWIDPDSIGEGGFGHILVKQADASNRSWQLIIDADAGSQCVGGTGDCFDWVNFNTSNGARNHDSPSGTADYGGGYISVVAVVSCSSTTLESCDAETQLYINGSPVTTTDGGLTGTIRTADSSDGFYIGNRPADDRTLDAKVKRVAVWNVGLTAGQITAVHSQGPDYVTP